MLTRKKFKEILDRLMKEFPHVKPVYQDPLEVLIKTILSQNTSDANRDRAYSRLRERFPNLLDIADSDPETIRELIRPAGMENIRARRLIDVVRIIREKYDGDLNWITDLPLDEARRRLLDLPGVGPKTADVVLLFGGRRDVFPVDRHVWRVSLRLGLEPKSKTYQAIRETLESITPEGMRGLAHLLLIELGRRYCRPANPKHESCPVRDLCEMRV